VQFFKLEAMVVLSTSILASDGSKPLLSRQFIEMPRMRIEGLLAAFPKLITSQHSQQHTFVETDTVRYVYQPLENRMYLLLITTKTSNIVDDLGTLRLLAKVVPDVAGGLTEGAVIENAFELIFAFDEVLTVGGYKEEVTLSAIQKNIAMESHDEKVHLMLEAKKLDDARKIMKGKEHDLNKRRLEAMKEGVFKGLGNDGQGGGTIPGGMQGIGGGGYSSGGYEGFGSDSAGFGSNKQFDDYNSTKKAEVEPDEGPRVVAKGMKLGGIGGNKKKDNVLSALAKEDNFSLLSSSKQTTDTLGLTASAPAPIAPSTPLTILLEEKYTVAMNREGGIESCDLKGTLTLNANTEVGATASLTLNKSVISSKCDSNWNFATHPKVNKPDYEKKGLITLKGGKGLPLNRPVGVIRWSYSGEDAVPLSINCWPEDEGTGSIIVNIEFELIRSDMNLHDVNILLPLGTTDTPSIESIDGQYKHDSKEGMICWHHDEINSNNSNGSLEFSIAGSDVEAFFPVQVMFQSDSFLCPIEVTGVTSTSNGVPIPNSLTKNVSPERYTIS